MSVCVYGGGENNKLQAFAGKPAPLYFDTSLAVRQHPAQAHNLEQEFESWNISAQSPSIQSLPGDDIALAQSAFRSRLQVSHYYETDQMQH
jgi:hypothetical protein